jgi:hypothetical protein
MRKLPFAILLTIRAVIIESADGMLGRWPHSHVREKDLKRTPLSAYFDISSPIMPMRWILGVVASLVHTLPNVIFGIAIVAVRAKVPPPFFIENATA